MVRVAVVSDTHAPRFWKSCPTPLARRLDGVDLILHAGDICIPSVLEELGQFAPLRAVKGNNDVDAVNLPGTDVFDIEGLTVAMIHDSGPRTGRLNRMRRRFPQADLVVYGHSHIPLRDEGDERLVLFNPGSPTDKRRQPHKTMGMLDVAEGRLLSAAIVNVD